MRSAFSRCASKSASVAHVRLRRDFDGRLGALPPRVKERFEPPFNDEPQWNRHVGARIARTSALALRTCARSPACPCSRSRTFAAGRSPSTRSARSWIGRAERCAFSTSTSTSSFTRTMRSGRLASESPALSCAIIDTTASTASRWPSKCSRETCLEVVKRNGCRKIDQVVFS